MPGLGVQRENGTPRNAAGPLGARLPTLSLFAGHTTCFKADWTVAGRHLLRGGAETAERLEGAWECASVCKCSLDSEVLSAFRQVTFGSTVFVWKTVRCSQEGILVCHQL